ncbi:hypothetical protein N9C27_03275 [Luminiphilus sp.]|nr:hypothetical protein [Luminiphilus sp.]
MTPTVIEIEASKFSAELTQLLADFAEGKRVDLSESSYSWVYEFFSGEMTPDNYDCACIHENYLKDWVFQDYDVKEHAESESDQISDSDRVVHARERIGYLIQDQWEVAPSMFFIDLCRSGVRQASTIIGCYSAGQGGWHYELVTSFLDGSYADELTRTGFIDLAALEKLEDQWILDRWTRDD